MGKYAAPKANYKNRKIVIMLMALTMVLGAISFAAARYVSNYRKEAQLHASSFHFSSDYLAYDSGNAMTTPKIKVSDWGERNVQFHLYNYEKENVALIADTDILYSILVNDGWDVSVSDSQGTAVEPDTNGSYTLKRSDNQSYHLVTLTYHGTDELPKADVTVASSSPYTKVLKASFIAATAKRVSYSVSDKGHYAELTIHTNQYYGPVTVTWDKEKHSPDNTDPLMVQWWDGNESGIIPNAQEFTTYTLIFFENQNYVSTSNDFTITTKTGA